MSALRLCLVGAFSALLALWISGSTARSSAAPAPSAGSPASTTLKLPAPIVYDRMVGPERAVTFRHETHVALADNRCIVCHPAPFRMLRPERRITHAAMDSGGSCGRCHDGRAAFAVKDSSACQTCHAGSAKAALSGVTPSSGAPKVPGPVTFRRGESSPGTVRFVHASHLAGDVSCARCHPKPWRMKATGGKPGGAMHEAASCGGCHDGTHAFGVEDAASCTRCHRDTATGSEGKR